MNRTQDAPEPPTAGRTSRGRSPAARYVIRFFAGLALYCIGLAVAVLFVPIDGAGPGAWFATLLTLPGIAAIAWALIRYYRECDEFVRKQLGEALVIGFALGTPAVLVVGVLQSFGLPSVSWMLAFAVYMTAWLIGSLVTHIRYR